MRTWLARKTVFRREWSVGLYEGKSPFALREYPHNPVLTTRSVLGMPVRFVADPFLYRQDGVFYLFFEVLNLATRRGEIAVAVSENAVNWQFQGVVLAEDHHLSFPQVWAFRDHVYMLPESHRNRKVSLYQAKAFPGGWEVVEDLLCGEPYSDAVLLFQGERWWLFTTADNVCLRLFSSPTLLGGTWVEHPKSPVYKGPFARPAGKLLVFEDQLYRFAQSPTPEYGTSIMVFGVHTLSEDEYGEEMLPRQPFLGPTGTGWNAMRMHHVDFLQTGRDAWLAVADGYSHALDTRLFTYPYKIRDRYLQSRGR